MCGTESGVCRGAGALDTMSRASLLRGHLREPPPIRPPWAGPEAAFLTSCDRCGRCARACPEKIIVAGRDGVPEVDFRRGDCSFCRDCVAACSTGALTASERAPWFTVAEIAYSCLSVQGVICRLCQERCQAAAIAFLPALGGYALPDVDAEACTGCGACVRICPVTAVRIAARW